MRQNLGKVRREFLEVHVPDERGLPRQGRAADPDEVTQVVVGVSSNSERDRLFRALEQYALALRYWYFGGGCVALTHLYIAVENLTKAAIRRHCVTQGVEEEELALSVGIEVEQPDSGSAGRAATALGACRRFLRALPRLRGPQFSQDFKPTARSPKWRHELDVWCRRELI